MSAFIYWVPDVTRQEGLAPLTSAQLADTLAEDELLGLPLPNLTGLGQPSSLIWFDATLSETHPLDNEITEHPVEQGPDITDHVRPQIDHLSLRVFVSNSPIHTAQEVLASLPRQAEVIFGAQDGSYKPLTLEYPKPPLQPNLSSALGVVIDALSTGEGPTGKGHVTVNTLQFDGPFDNVVEVYEALKFLRDNATLVEVVTSVRSYESMILKSVIMNRSREFGSGAEIQLEFKQMVIVSTASVPAPIEIAATPKKDKGVKTPTAVTTAELKSNLFNGTAKLGGVDPLKALAQ